MKIGFHTGYWSAGPPPGAAEAVARADALGFDSVWTAEAYGSDALTPLAWWGARTHTALLGTGIAQLDARTPAATAMAALTLDHLSGGRFILGLGVSGPQVVEGWYGRPYARPLARTREYVEIVRSVLARSGPLTAPGPHYPLPLPEDDGGSGRGKALTSTVHPLRADLPIHLAAQGPRNVALAAEIADGWLPAFFTPSRDSQAREHLAAGFDRRSPERSPASAFEVSAIVPVALGADVEQAARLLAPHVALYVGGMGSSEANFHREAIARAGWAEACEEVAELYPRDRRAAAAAVPTELVLDLALAGSPAEIREQARRWEATCVTRLIVQTDPRALPALAEALL
ncbi:LLM class F420-dependent oxidoreductase [Pseudactinotalea sp. HY160]|uniref:LLM class F420-dependent oxidoreductase n=1 Tax=Pseudactinotalea sp. HY160 TaxID=2654490 RepID=UPI00128BC8DE|nr:LLM class F420-dependent oxidoreductase [Pseudactinotalea sp. HY160]MPV49133.1 LLM class F420-dependent oxidoreductase [Pseudactinotalea sp. HY160]